MWLELVELFEDDPSASNQLAGEAVMIDRPQFLYQLATIAKSYDTTTTAAPTIATAHSVLRPSPPNVYSPAAAQSMDWHSVNTPQASGAASRTTPNSAMSWSEQLEHAMTPRGEVTVAYLLRARVAVSSAVCAECAAKYCVLPQLTYGFCRTKASQRTRAL